MVCSTELYRPVRTVHTGPTDFRYADRLLSVREHCSTVAELQYLTLRSIPLGTPGCTARYTVPYRYRAQVEIPVRYGIANLDDNNIISMTSMGHNSILFGVGYLDSFFCH